MSDLIIKIGDDALDLSDDQTVAITKQAAKVGDFSTVLADGTNELTVALTPNNQRIMDNAHLMPSDSNKPYGRLDATLIQEGYETIQDGYAIIKSSSNNFSLQLIGGNASFFDRIKDLSLRDLYWSDYTHFWTNQEVFDRRNETEGLVYTLFEQSGTGGTTLTTYGTNQYALETALLLPSVYIKTIVEKIFEAHNYSFVTDLVSENIYDKAVIFRGKIPDRGSDMSYHECTVRNETDQIIDYVFSFDHELFLDASVDSTTSIFASSSGHLATLQGGADCKFRLTDSCRLTVSFDLIIENITGDVDVVVNIIHTTPSGETTTQTNQQTVVNGTANYTFTADIECSLFEEEIYFQPNLEHVVPGLQVVTVKEDSTYTVSNVQLIANAGITPDFPFNYLTGVTMIPDRKQGEFLKELAKTYQWIFDTDERTHTVTARRFDEIKENIPNAIDLSSKVHQEPRTKKINFGIDGFAQTNALRYKEDDVTKYDGVGYINVSDTTLKAEKDFVKMSEFAATSARTRFDTVNAPYVPLFEELLPTNGLTNRILLVRQETFPYNINFHKDGNNLPTSDVTFAYFAEAGNSDSLDFPTLITRFYQTIIDMNDKAKTFDCLVDLNIRDVQNYDPFIPVYIQSEGNYFYWEKLSKYVKDKLTKCRFIKI